MSKRDPGAGFWALVTPHTGKIHKVRFPERGYSSDVTAIAESESGPVFLKAVRAPSAHASSFAREAEINPYVRTVTPALLWRLQDNGWIILAFEAVKGKYADFTPGSPDMPAIVDAVNAIGTIDCPRLARDWRETRWDRFTDQPTMFEGDALLYTDINPDNFLVTDKGISVVDWSWPTRGAGFIDPACLVIQLIAAGHTPAEAEKWAAGCDAWQCAKPEAIDAFAMATVRMYRHFESRDPAPWRRAMTSAVTNWSVHRTTPRKVQSQQI